MARLPPRGHGVAGVDHEVKQSAFKAAYIDEDGWDVGVVIGGDIDLRPDGAGGELERALYRLFDTNQGGAQLLAAGEGEQAAGEVGSAAGGFLGALHAFERHGIQRVTRRSNRSRLPG